MASSSLKNVAVVGAGGNLGPFILRALLDNSFNVTVIARASSQATFPSSLRVLKGDYSAPFLSSAFQGIDAVVLAVSTHALAEQKLVIDAAAKAGVKRIIPSEFGSIADVSGSEKSTTNPETLKAVPLFQTKADVINHVRDLAVEYPALTWTAVVNGPFYDWCLKLGFFSFDLPNQRATIYDHGLGKFDTTTLSTIGSAVASILSHGANKYTNQYLYISSFTTSQAEILAALQKASGNSNWQIEDKDSEAYMQGARAKMARGEFEGVYDLVFGTTFQAGNGADYSTFKTISNADLGLEEEDLDVVTKEVLEGNRHQMEW